MSQATIEAHYLPNRRLSDAMGFVGYNCGYSAARGQAAFADYQKALLWRLIGNTPIHADSTVLDIGCGIGGPTEWVLDERRPRRIIGVEYCRSSVVAAETRCAGRATRPRFIQGDAHHLPIASGSVDVIINLESALHYADKQAFLRECRRVLVDGGTLCLGDITAPLKALFAPFTLLNRLPTQFNSNIRLWSSKDYLRAFAAANLRIDHHEEVSTPVADSLADGLDEIRRRGWNGCKGFRGRALYLVMLEKLLRSRRLTYELFQLSAANSPGSAA